MFSTYVSQFVTIACLHAMAVVCPGPDFALVAKKALLEGRIAGLYTSVGIALAMIIHVSYVLVGLHFFSQAFLDHISVIRTMGSLYLLYLGLSGLLQVCKAKRLDDGLLFPDPHDSCSSLKERPWKHVVQGLLTNGLNPKAIIFVVTIYSVVVDPTTPSVYLTSYGAWMCLVNLLWFAALTCFLNRKLLRKKLLSHRRHIEAATSLFFIIMSILLFVGQLSR